MIQSKGGIKKEDVNATKKKLTPAQKECVKRKVKQTTGAGSEAHSDTPAGSLLLTNGLI